MSRAPATPETARAAAIVSPCTGVCRIDAASGLCDGCRRTLDEIAAWSTLDQVAKRAVWSAIELRRVAKKAEGGLR